MQNTGSLLWLRCMIGPSADMAQVLLQAIISGTFSIIRQSLMLGCFPRVKIVHTSGLVEGQIYIPEANWIMMVLTIIVVAGFRDQDAISNAYGALALRYVLLGCILALHNYAMPVTKITRPEEAHKREREGPCSVRSRVLK